MTGKDEGGRGFDPKVWLFVSVLAPILVAVVGGVILNPQRPWWIDIFTGPTSAPQSIAPHSTEPQTPIAEGSSQPPPPSANAESSTLTGCVLTIDFSFVDLQAEPSHTATRLANVPEGEYSAAETTVVNWAGLDQRWFKITADQRTGWVVDDGIQISGKSAECP